MGVMEMKKAIYIGIFYTIVAILLTIYIQHEKVWTLGFFVTFVIEFFLLCTCYLCIDRAGEFLQRKMLKRYFNHPEGE